MMFEALRLYTKSGQVSHSWCMCVVNHGFGGLDGGRDGGGGWYSCGIKSGGMVACREMLEHISSAR